METSTPVVFWNLRDSKCTECGAEIPSGSFLYLEKREPLCLACADFDDLEFLPSGDTALTRRATKYSEKIAVVVKFSRSRKRYERQGILVTDSAIAKAEEECASDAPQRAAERAKAAVAREKGDVRFVGEFTTKIRAMFPGCPPEEAKRIAAHAAVRGSGRVGRSEAGRKLDADAVTLAVVAAVRHHHTEYDQLLARGVDRQDARERVWPKIEMVLEAWRFAV